MTATVNAAVFKQGAFKVATAIKGFELPPIMHFDPITDAWRRDRQALERRVRRLAYGGKKGRSAKRWLDRHHPHWPSEILGETPPSEFRRLSQPYVVEPGIPLGMG